MSIKAYKGFNADMTCRDFQYEEGKTYETNTADICSCGFHACLLPLDCLDYYNTPFINCYHEVELDGVYSYETMFFHNDTKIAATKITIGKRLFIPDMKKYEENLFSDESVMDEFLKPFETFNEAGKKYFTALVKNYIRDRANPEFNIKFIESMLRYYLSDSHGYLHSMKGKDYPSDKFEEPKRISDTYFLIMGSLDRWNNGMRISIYDII